MVKFDLFDVLLTRPLLSRSGQPMRGTLESNPGACQCLDQRRWHAVGKLTWPSMLWWWGRVDQQQDTHQGIKTCGLCTKDPQPGFALKNLLAQPLSHKCHLWWRHIASNSDVQGITIGKSVSEHWKHIPTSVRSNTFQLCVFVLFFLCLSIAFLGGGLAAPRWLLLNVSWQLSTSFRWFSQSHKKIQS